MRVGSEVGEAVPDVYAQTPCSTDVLVRCVLGGGIIGSGWFVVRCARETGSSAVATCVVESKVFSLSKP